MKSVMRPAERLSEPQQCSSCITLPFAGEPDNRRLPKNNSAIVNDGPHALFHGERPRSNPLDVQLPKEEGMAKLAPVRPWDDCLRNEEQNHQQKNADGRIATCLGRR